MKHTFYLLVGFLLLANSVFSQIRTPPLSQKQKLEQNVGFTKVKIEYCRPLMRGREIFGELEEYGEIWRTGANRNSQITFSKSVTIGETQLKPDTYTLFTRPNPIEWQVYFYPYNNEFGVPNSFSEEEASATITVPVVKLNRNFQNLTINLENVTANTADLSIVWENVYIAIPIKFTTEEQILNNVDNILNSHSGDYYMAAKYYLDTEMDLEKAKSFIQKSIDLRNEPGGTPQYWYYQLQAEILLANNDNEDGLKAARTALEMKESRGEDDKYLRQLQELVKKLSN